MIDSLLFWFVTKLIFFPSKTIAFYPQQWELKFEEVFIESTEGIKLHGWFFPGGPPERTLIFFHGNAGNIGDRLPKLKVLHGLGMNIFIFDYRGYGGSEGQPSLEGVMEDARAAYHYVLSRKDVNPNHIILYGESLGGAMAAQIASEEKYAALILESAFTSIKDMARSAYPFMAGLAPDVYRTSDIMPRLRQPTLILHGKDDRTVPFKMGQELFDKAPHPKRFIPFEGTNHNDMHEVARDRYIESIDSFLAEIGQ